MRIIHKFDTEDLKKPVVLEYDDITDTLYANGKSLDGGGRDSIVQSATVTLTAMQIKALNTTPITIIASPGVGKVIYPNQIIFQYKFGTTPYDATGVTFELGWAPSADNNNQSVAMAGLSFIDQSVNMLGTANGFAGNSSAGNSDPQSLGVNKAFVIDTPTAPTLGDGTLTVTVYYTVVTLT